MPPPQLVYRVNDAIVAIIRGAETSHIRNVATLANPEDIDVIGEMI